MAKAEAFNKGLDHRTANGCEKCELGPKQLLIDGEYALRVLALDDENAFREGCTAASEVLERDHYPDCITMFLAGGGVKAGSV